MDPNAGKTVVVVGEVDHDLRKALQKVASDVVQVPAAERIEPGEAVVLDASGMARPASLTVAPHGFRTRVFPTCKHPRQSGQDLPCAWPTCAAGTGVKHFRVELDDGRIARFGRQWKADSYVWTEVASER
jgi:hypothetical protein